MYTTASAKEIIAKLPNYCFSKNLVDNKIIRIKTGEMGFYPINPQPFLLAGETIDDFINEKNRQLGVTRGQREAMDIGSCFGWEVPGANPDNYTDEGYPIK